MSDIVAKIDSSYRTIPRKDSRAIGGLSIGALQSIHISASYPDTFGYVGMFSPFIHPFVKHSDHSSFYRQLKKKQELQFADPPELYWIMIGRTDFFYPRIKLYCRYLDRQGYGYEYYDAPGGHEWYNWEPFCNMFMQRMFSQNP